MSGHGLSLARLISRCEACLPWVAFAGSAFVFVALATDVDKGKEPSSRSVQSSTQATHATPSAAAAVDPVPTR
jgi:hypothetical protein